jgi:hypothetical protein
MSIRVALSTSRPPWSAHRGALGTPAATYVAELKSNHESGATAYVLARTPAQHQLALGSGNNCSICTGQGLPTSQSAAACQQQTNGPSLHSPSVHSTTLYEGGINCNQTGQPIMHHQHIPGGGPLLTALMAACAVASTASHPGGRDSAADSMHAKGQRNGGQQTKA